MAVLSKFFITLQDLTRIVYDKMTKGCIPPIDEIIFIRDKAEYIMLLEKHIYKFPLLYIEYRRKLHIL